MASGHRETLSAARSAFKTLVLLCLLYSHRPSPPPPPPLPREFKYRSRRERDEVTRVSMGCGGSKPDTGRENLPTPSSSAAAVEEEEEGGKKLAAMEAVEEAATVEAEEEKGKKLCRAVAEDEQLPGSPSFRFYFAGSADGHEPDDGSLILQREGTERSKHSVAGSKHKSQPLSSTREDLDTKQGKTKKRKSKLRALTKAPMIHILNARSYSKVAHARDHQAL